MAYSVFSADILDLGTRVNRLKSDIRDYSKSYKVLIAQAESCKALVDKMYDYASANQTTVTQEQYNTLVSNHSELDQAIIYIQEQHTSFWRRLIAFVQGATQVMLSVLSVIKIVVEKKLLPSGVGTSLGGFLGKLAMSLLTEGKSSSNRQLPPGRSR